MGNRVLHAALRDFAEQSADQLAADAAEGLEVPFELVESRRGRRSLYSYRPLTDDFIRGRLGVLGRLPAHAPAMQALEGLGGLERYLSDRGERRIPDNLHERAEAVLRSFLQDVFDGASEFMFSAERFARAYAVLENAVFEGRAVVTLIAPVLGLVLQSPEVPLAEGLSLVRGDVMDDAPDDARWQPGSNLPSLLAVVTLDSASGDGAPLTAARDRLARLQTALRLYDDGNCGLAPVAWARKAAAPWRVVPIGGRGRPSATIVVEQAQEDELRGFCNLVARRAPSQSDSSGSAGELRWALARFEMGCEREDPLDALTDHLLALRALLEPEGPGSGRLAGRLAAICALPEDRSTLAERVAHAISLERAIVAGVAPVESAAAGLVDELSRHLRALLRDVICGHLHADVLSVAEELLYPPAAEQPAVVAVPAAGPSVVSA
ncbi:MAG TPA: hypothetical protein VHE14_08100 [Solirubrobacteraceae bacterium]|nr:hypothetical protein [Solirubrobacteraceae bacterium]